MGFSKLGVLTAVVCLLGLSGGCKSGATSKRVDYEAKAKGYIQVLSAPKDLSAELKVDPLIVEPARALPGEAEAKTTVHNSYAYAATMAPSGALRYYTDYTSPDEGLDESRAYISHEDLAASLVETVAKVGGPEHLVAESFEPEDKFAVAITMRPQPYGYEAPEGGAVIASVYRRIWHIETLSLPRTWEFTPPKIKVTKEEAIAKAASLSGGQPEDWSANLEYRAQRPLTPNGKLGNADFGKKQRLYFIVRSNEKEVRVDAETGAVLHH